MDISDKALKIVTDGFEQVNKRLDVYNGRLDFLEMRLFGDKGRKIESVIEEVEKNKDRSFENQRRLDIIEPEHKKMWGSWSKFWGIMAGLSVVSAGLIKLLEYLLK